MSAVLAVDVGGTKLAAGIVTDRGDVVTRAHVATPTDGDPEVLFAALIGVIGEIRVGDEVVCGVGCGGPMRGDLVSPLNIHAWRDFPLRERLQEEVGLSTFVENDAKALALGEGWCGAAAGARDFIAMVVSTGVGGGIVLDGQLLDGALGNAGHVGHVIVRPGGRECGCGALGCLEAEASGTGIRRRTGRAPEDATPEVIVDVGTMVGRAVASVCNLLDLRLAVVAGSVALGYGEPFFSAAQAELDRCARLAFSSGARIIPAGLGHAGPLVGAAAVGLRGIDART